VAHCLRSGGANPHPGGVNWDALLLCQRAGLSLAFCSSCPAFADLSFPFLCLPPLTPHCHIGPQAHSGFPQGITPRGRRGTWFCGKCGSPEAEHRLQLGSFSSESQLDQEMLAHPVLAAEPDLSTRWHQQHQLSALHI
jgi:hypothetical protein